MKITIFNIDDGSIKRCVTCQQTDVEMQLSNNESYIDGHFSDSIYRIVNGVAEIKPFDVVASREAKDDLIDSWRTEARYLDVTAIGYTWQADEGSQALLTQAIVMASQGIVPAPPSWRTSDNIDVAVTLDDLKAIAAAMAIQTSMAFYKSFQLKNAVAAATTQAELDAIVW